MIRDMIEAAIGLITGSRPKVDTPPETQDDFQAAMQRWTIILEKQPK